MKKITKYDLEKYSRQIIIDKIGISGQQKIYKSSVAIVGCGGLGTSVAQYLSMSGVGNIILIDDDEIILSNLNRQTLFTEKDIGNNKSKILAFKIKKIHPTAKIEYEENKLTSKNMDKIIKKFSIIIDCTDNFESRLLINKYCHNNKKILISAALQNFDIQAFIFASWKGKDNPCYKCIFPNVNKNESISCDEMGITAPVAGLGGLIQANLAINYILNFDVNFKELILLDCTSLNTRKIILKKNLKCKICRK